MKNNIELKKLCETGEKATTVISYGYAIDSYAELEDSDSEIWMDNAIDDFVKSPVKDVIWTLLVSKLSQKINW